MKGEIFEIAPEQALAPPMIQPQEFAEPRNYQFTSSKAEETQFLTE